MRGPLLEALLPVAVVIGLGYALRRSGFLPRPAWAPIDRLVYHVLFPAFLFSELARAPLAGLPAAPLAAALLGTLATMAAAANLARRAFGLPGPAYTSVLQGVTRFNTFVTLALVAPLFGPGALPLGALAVALLVPAANLLGVAALARHGEGARGLVWRALLTNPLILGCVAGAGWSLTGLPLPRVVADTAALLGRPVLALGLLSVGAGLELAGVARRPALLLAVCAGKLAAMPLLAYAYGRLLGLEGVPLGVAVLAVAAPTATSAYILARQLGGDADLMAAIVVATTLASLLTLPLALSLPF